MGALRSKRAGTTACLCLPRALSASLASFALSMCCVGVWAGRRLGGGALAEAAPLPASVCAHRAARGGGARAPVTAAEYGAAMAALAAEGVVCFDVDVVALGDGAHGVGHPSTFAAHGARAAEPATVADFFAALPPGATATLELKGALGADEAFVARLAAAARETGVLDRIAVFELAPARAPRGLPLAVALRDRAGADGSVCGGVDARGAGAGAEREAAALAAALAAYDVVSPSARCLELASVRGALAQWSAARAAGAARAGAGGPASASVQTWIVDEPAQARKVARALGAELGARARFISNEPAALARALAAQ